tara:strand:- start:1658 stop:2026 length:369 start_codon:yes stop_codon:yes gene_type:complete
MANNTDIYNATLGQYGSSFITGDGGTVDFNGTSSKMFVIAITMLADTTFQNLQTYKGEIKSISTVTAENDHDAEFGAASNATDITTSHTFPKGVTIFGRWDFVELNSGTCVCYFAPQPFNVS